MSISVIVPTLNESEYIVSCLSRLQDGFEGEILVVDGGSDDDTLAKTRGMGVETWLASKGVASQCNFGAEKAKGEVLFFVSADCLAPFEWSQKIESAIQSPYIAGGGFSLEIEQDKLFYRMIAFGGNFRSRLHGFSLPDQGLFVRKADFVRLGGFSKTSEIPFALFCHKLKQLGEFKILPDKMTASTRKWEQHGKIATTLRHMTTFRKYRSQEL